MSFPTQFLAKAEVLAPQHNTSHTRAVLDGLERALYAEDAEIVHHGEDYLEFKVPLTEWLRRDFTRVWRRPYWPLSLVSGGTVSVREDLGVYRITAHLRTSFYPLVQLAPFALGALVTPVQGSWARLIAGVVAGLVCNAAIYVIGKWQFGGWLQRLGFQISDDLSRGRLTRA